MSLKLGDVFPNFQCKTTKGEFSIHDYIDNSWCIFFSHPYDFTPVCTTELAEAAKLAPEFEKRGVKMIALSVNPIDVHAEWIEDIKAYGQIKDDIFPYPIMEDPERDISKVLGMLDPDELDKTGIPLTCRACFILGPDKRLKLSILYPATTGRNFKEILRVIDSLQLCSKYMVATPVNWQPGDKCMLQPAVKPEDYALKFPKGVETLPVPSGKQYLRLTDQP